MSGNDWLKKLKAGDKCWRTRSGGMCSMPVTVSRVSGSSVFVKYEEESAEYRHDRRFGRSHAGDKWNYQTLLEDTHELREMWELRIAQNKCVALRGRLEIPQTLEGCRAFMIALKPYLKALKESEGT